MNPMKEGILKLSNTVDCGGRKAGGIAAYNLTQFSQTYRFSPRDVLGLPADKTYLIYDYFRKSAQVCTGTDCVMMELDPGGFAWHQILPLEQRAVFLGLTEKYVGFSALKDAWFTPTGMIGILHEQGPTGFACAWTPRQVYCNGTDVTDLLVKETDSGSMGIYSIPLDIKAGRTVLDIRWASL